MPCFHPGGLVSIAVLFLVLGVSCGGVASRTQSSMPDIVLVVVDTLRADRTQLLGHWRKTTPNLQQMAKDAVVYEQAMSQAPWTTPSIGSMLTSRYPSSMGIHRYRVPLPASATTLAEVLKGAGYSTGAVVSHTYCGKKLGFAQGFDLFDENAVKDRPDAVNSQEVSSRAIDMLDELERPFFLLVHYFDPHFAYVEHTQYAFGGAAGYTGPVESAMPIRTLRKMAPRLDQADVDELLRIYDSEIAYTDQQIGVLLQALKSEGLYDEAVLALTADHGEEFMDHGRWGHTVRLYQESVHVPLLIKYPDGKVGLEQEPVALVDLAPTLLAAVGLEPPASFVGRNLRNSTLAERDLFSETSKGASMEAVLRGSHKLIHDKRSQTWELFDLEADPGERHDMSLRMPGELRELKQALADWDRMVSPGTLPERVEISPEERSRLEALGYLED